MRFKLLIIAILITSASFAQSTKQTTFGFKGGLNFSDILGVDSKGEKSGYAGTELYGSFFADTQLNERWNLENELLFSYTEDYNFLEIPVHLKYKVFDKWNVLFGPKIDFILDNDNDAFERSTYEFKNFGVAFEIGAQYNISNRLFAELRYSKGLTEQITDFVLDFNNAKRNTLRLGLGIRF